MSEYDSVQRGGLKIKGLSDHGVKKKKKKKSKDREKEKQHLELALTNEQDEATSLTTAPERVPYVAKKTKAELAFEKVKEKRQAEQILEKASTNHKERIMELNSHLDTLTEHFDIPKVSWTK